MRVFGCHYVVCVLAVCERVSECVFVCACVRACVRSHGKGRERVFMGG